MTNKDIIAAITRIAKFKILKKEADQDRSDILAELKRRKKDKINLGGPTREDYVKRNVSDKIKIHPIEVYRALLEAGVGPDRALEMTLDRCTITQKEFKGINVNGEALFKLVSIPADVVGQNIRLSYRISTDKQNALRGIDL
ncbi:MAG: hypothetical protein ACQ5SW_04705 [Sphaerochaetaceae bacterium]